MINRDRLAALRKIEDERFLALHPKSGELFAWWSPNVMDG
jgi:glutamate-1-semialdehyde 2,1-aminomutase